MRRHDVLHVPVVDLFDLQETLLSQLRENRVGHPQRQTNNPSQISLPKCALAARDVFQDFDFYLWGNHGFIDVWGIS